MHRFLICTALFTAICANIATVGVATGGELRIFPDTTRIEIVTLPSGADKPAK